MRACACVQSREGWCATKDGSLEYRDDIETLCGQVVTCTWGLERRQPDCPDCIAKRKERGDA